MKLGCAGTMKEGACILHIISDIPGILKDADAEKISKALDIDTEYTI